MMSQSAIRDLSQQAALRAARDRKVPFIYEVGDTFDTVSIPFIGDHRPEGWELTDKHFVDTSGFGEPDEPALTQKQVLDLMARRRRESDDVVGWAVIELGQFQGWLGEFHRPRRH